MPTHDAAKKLEELLGKHKAKFGDAPTTIGLAGDAEIRKLIKRLEDSLNLGGVEVKDDPLPNGMLI